MAERDIPYEVPELRYVEVDRVQLSRMRGNMRNWWGDQIPIATCVRCGRYMEDPNRDSEGDPMHENPEDDREPVCSECRLEDFSEALEEDILLLLEDKLGLAERHRGALKLFIETIFTDPQKILLQMQDLNNRVRELEKQTNLLWMAFMGAILALLIALAALVVSMVG